MKQIERIFWKVRAQVNIFLAFVFLKKYRMKGALRKDLLNATPNREQILSFELLEKTHFQESFHWIDMCNIS